MTFMSRLCLLKVIKIIITIICCSVVIVTLITFNIKKNVKRFGLDKEYNNISVVKTYKGKLSEKKEEEIIKTIIQGMGGNIVNKRISSEQRQVYAYSPFLKNKINYKNLAININIVIKYMKDLNMTNVYISSPVVNMDY